MQNLIIFDLDGVLVDSKEIHFNALNQALSEIDKRYIISTSDQKNIYEGLPTNKKLEILSNLSGLDKSLHNKIWKRKQEITAEMFSSISHDNDLVEYFKYIKSKNINIAIASNSIRKTIQSSVKNLGISGLVDFIASNEDVKNPKPHPEIYWLCMSYFDTIPSKTLIFEDSVVGKLAATDSYAKLIPIKNRNDLTHDKIASAIEQLENGKLSWRDKALNVLIPMAGAGSRFSSAGYIFPKPLIDVNGKPMIQAVVDNLAIDAQYTFIVQKDHYDKYSLSYILNLISPNCHVVQVDGLTEGAAITALAAKELIDNDSPLLIANSDQLVKWNSREFLYELTTINADGGIATFKSVHPKWSYARVDDYGIVLEVAEKKPISNNATVGIYYWKKGSDFVKYAEKMIANNERVNGEFYICPIFNEAIKDGKLIKAIEVEEMHGIGTPEDLQQYLRGSND